MTDIIWVAFGALFLVGILELILSATWNRAYFTIGLPIFIRRVPVTVFSFALLDTEVLESEFSSTFFSNSLAFKELDDGIYAFRSRLFEISWFRRQSASLMHGLLILDQTRQEVIVKGYANWLIIVLLPFIILLGAMQNSLSWWGVLLSGVAIAGIGYAFESNRYGKVAEKAAMLADAPRRPVQGEFV